jgi:hypothetical protein
LARLNHLFSEGVPTQPDAAAKEHILLRASATAI